MIQGTTSMRSENGLVYYVCVHTQRIARHLTVSVKEAEDMYPNLEIEMAVEMIAIRIFHKKIKDEYEARLRGMV